MATIKPGVAWSHIQSSIVSVLTNGLVDLGLLNGNVDELIASEAYKPFYMHSSGHWLGLDVHDVGAYSLAGASRPLLPRMVLTVEPGLYIKPGMPGVDSRWWGIGVRIEDDIVVTEAGFENLSAALPSSIDSLEDLLNE
ncbi:MAG: hypothetical protein B7X00_01450 [Legionella sp. 21-45-4]|nr:MAG: hypothetical protein B7X00_01450 [Legionella sp. 21-45-4]